jgi:2-methylcitrate dehydratase
MDHTTEVISSYAMSLDYSHIPPDTVHETKRRIIDALGCAMGGFLSEPAKIARRMASMTSSALPARVLGSGDRTSPDMAAFANTVMVRYLDCNDTFISSGGTFGAGHPSDMLPAVLAVADPGHASGEDVINATVLAYQIAGRFTEQQSTRGGGWDQGIFVVIASACATGKILGLTEKQMAHAVSLAITPNLPLGQTRVGELPMWKGCATAAATRNGVFAALLAGEGMEGPSEPFEGARGLFEQATGPMSLDPIGGDGLPFKIDATSIKYFPSQIHTQGPISLALGLREKVSPNDIEAINLEIYQVAWRSAGSEPEKWDPQTRETADHSIPYVVAVAFSDGAVTPSSFIPDRVRDPALRPLMQRVNIKEAQELTQQFPEAQASRMEVVTKSGERFVEQVSHPKGHRQNPLTDGELEDKFCSLAGAVLTLDQCRRALDMLWDLERVEDIGPVLDLLQV